jgi:hypothetical protein
MNCAEFWDQMPELASGDSSEHGHLRDCPQCAGLIERQRRLASGLRTMAGDMRAVAAPPRVEANLIEVFRREVAPARPRTVRIRWIPAFSWAAAAAAVIAMGVLVVVPRRHVAIPAVHHSPAPAVELAQLADEGADDDGFIPLPNAERVGPNDDVNVVRMELTRSAMLVVGLDVSPDRVSEPVQAEVMLGPDGLARAVRFVDTDGTN